MQGLYLRRKTELDKFGYMMQGILVLLVAAACRLSYQETRKLRIQDSVPEKAESYYVFCIKSRGSSNGAVPGDFGSVPVLSNHGFYFQIILVVEG